MPPWVDPVVLQGADEGAYIDAVVMHWNGEELRITQGDDEGSVLLDREQCFWLFDYLDQHMNFEADEAEEDEKEET